MCETVSYQSRESFYRIKQPMMKIEFNFGGGKVEENESVSLSASHFPSFHEISINQAFQQFAFYNLLCRQLTIK